MLALDDDHSEFLDQFRDDPLLRRALPRLRGLRPLRLGTVTHSLLRAVCGQLIQARLAREIERNVIRAASPRVEGTRLRLPPTPAALARFAPAELRRLGLGARRGATLVRLCRSVDLERLRSLPTDAAAETGWSASAASARGRSASSASKGSAASSAGSSATWVSSSSARPCAGGGSRPGRRRSCWSRTAAGPGSRASTCSPRPASASCRSRGAWLPRLSAWRARWRSSERGRSARRSCAGSSAAAGASPPRSSSRCGTRSARESWPSATASRRRRRTPMPSRARRWS